MITKLMFIIMIIITVFFSLAYAQEPALMPGWPIELEAGMLATPRQGLTFYDLNGDGDLEILIGVIDKVYAFNYMGYDMEGWPYVATIRGSRFNNSPVVGDIDGDGEPEIVLNSRILSERSGYLYAWESDGTLMEGFPFRLGQSSFQLALCDLNEDGAMEIITAENELYPDTIALIKVYDYTGSMLPGWPVEGFYGEYVAVGDIDSDDRPELVIGGIGLIGMNGDILALEADGSIMAGFPIELDEGNDTIEVKGAPILFDMDGNETLEIMQIYGRDDDYGHVGVFNHLGEMMESWPLYYGEESRAGPSIAESGNPGEYYASFGSKSHGNFFLVNMESEIALGWPFWTGEYGVGNMDQSTIGDIDGDGFLDFVFNYSMAVWDDSSQQWLGRIWALNKEGELLSYFPFWVHGPVFPGAVSLGDIDNDGIVEMSFTTVGWSEIIRIFVYKLTDIPYEPERFPWPMSCHDPQHTNNLTHRIETSIPAYDEQTGLPRRVLLHENHPNPFNASTKIEFGIPNNGYVNLKVYNLLGQEIAELVDEKLTAGEYSVAFNGDNLSSGIYFYHLKFGDNKTISRKMLLLK